MTQFNERVRHLFTINIEAKIALVDTVSEMIAEAGQRLANCLLNDGKIFLGGNGGSAANCQHFSTAMLHHFDVERPPLPVITLSADATALTAIANENHYEQIFARQIQALGHDQDMLIVLTTTGNANSILHAINAAHDRGMDVIALNGRDGGLLANHLGPEDLEIRIPGDTAAHVREMHLFVLHCFCDLIDQALFGQVG